MTAVAPPPNFQPISQSRWNPANGALNSVSADDVSRMFMPRKSVQRSNSSTSLSSVSSNSTIPASSMQTNGISPSGSGDGWGPRKKPARNQWPPSKAEPMTGLSTARPQPVSLNPGPSAVSNIASLQHPPSMLPSQHNGQPPTQQNGIARAQGPNEPVAMLHLLTMNGSFERKTITVPFYPDVLKIGRQTNNKTIPTPSNGYFDSKVLSRQHAEVWADRNGKVWIRDVKSSNGTFVNGQRLSQENRDSDPHELHEQDMLELGIDIVSEDQKTIVHHKVAARVEYAGIYPNGTGNALDLNFGELDSGANGNVMGNMIGQGMGQLRGRAGSNGSVGSNGRMGGPASVAGSNMSAISQQRHMNFWLQPVTMEQVVKRLNSELKLAKQQSQDLQRTTHFLDCLVTADSKKEHKGGQLHIKTNSLKADIKTRFSDPPAPPPQQPLPEKPDVARALGDASHQPLLKRADTERPKSTTSPIRTDPAHQITSLAEALNTARKEIESQNLRLKDLENLLALERQARETAEERALRLEVESQANQKESPAAETSEPEQSDDDDEKTKSSSVDADSQNSPTENGDAHIATVDAASSRIQLQLERMVEEMGMMKQQMEDYRQRAEKAEAERDQDRASLAAMVERIRKEEADRVARAAKKQHRSSPVDEEGHSHDDHKENGAVVQNGHAITPDRALALLRKAGVQDGRPVTPEQVSQLEKAFSQALAQPSRRNDALAMHGGPVASMVTVVLLGVGLMAWLNSWPKVER